jgi:hypothetical protein
MVFPGVLLVFDFDKFSEGVLITHSNNEHLNHMHVNYYITEIIYMYMYKKSLKIKTKGIKSIGFTLRTRL